MLPSPYLLHAVSPLHAGTGQSVDVIDLPIARLRHSGIPIVPGPSVKGVLRDARRPAQAATKDQWLAAFGPETSEAADHAGALVVGDARLLALPVRSFRGTFAWVTSPLLLELARRDLGAAAPAPVPSLAMLSEARVGELPGAIPDRGAVVVHAADKKTRVFLEDLDLPVQASDEVKRWAEFLAPFVEPTPGALLFARRFVLVDDETMTFLWETATQIDARVRLNESTRTVAAGALWTEESLPAETLLIGLLGADRSRRQNTAIVPEAILQGVLPIGAEEILQFGGKASVGRGLCRIVRLAV